LESGSLFEGWILPYWLDTLLENVQECEVWHGCRSSQMLVYHEEFFNRLERTDFLQLIGVEIFSLILVFEISVINHDPESVSIL